MSDLMNEERNEKIRKQWLEVIETNESLFANLLKKENLPSEKLLEIEKRQKKGQELKKRIEDGHIPDEPPIRGYKRVDQQWVPISEEEADELDNVMEDLDESGHITIDPCDLDDDDFIDEEKPQPMPEIQKQKEGGNKIIERIRDFFRRKPKHPLSEKTINRIAAGFWGAIAFCAIVFGFTQTIEVFFTVVGLIAIFSFVFGPLLLFWGRATRPPVKEKTEDDLYGKGWEARQKKLREVGKILEERDKREGK